MGSWFLSGVVMPTLVAGAHLGSQSLCLGPERDPVIIVGSCCILPTCMWVVVPIFGHQVIVLILNFLLQAPAKT
jgi:hypothetical protein